MKNLKDEAKDQGNWTGYGNYTMQEIILGKVASGLRSTDLCTTGKRWPVFRRAKSRSRRRRSL
ncbi:MAG: hypothetical protein ACLUD2_08860 [Clostridium sp.]